MAADVKTCVHQPMMTFIVSVHFTVDQWLKLTCMTLNYLRQIARTPVNGWVCLTS